MCFSLTFESDLRSGELVGGRNDWLEGCRSAQFHGGIWLNKFKVCRYSRYTILLTLTPTYIVDHTQFTLACILVARSNVQKKNTN